MHLEDAFIKSDLHCILRILFISLLIDVIHIMFIVYQYLRMTKQPIPPTCVSGEWLYESHGERRSLFPPILESPSLLSQCYGTTAPSVTKTNPYILFWKIKWWWFWSNLDSLWKEDWIFVWSFAFMTCYDPWALIICRFECDSHIFVWDDMRNVLK